jgi:pimeloyl-ACP methyl ester carboxylesterase
LGWLLGRQLGAAQEDPERFTLDLIKMTHGPDREVLEALDVDQRRRFVTTPLIEALRQGPAGGVEEMRLLRAPWGFGVQHIEVPVHLWHGRDDEATPLAMGGWLAAMIPGVDARLLDDEGHISTILRYRDEALDVLLGG